MSARLRQAALRIATALVLVAAFAAPGDAGDPATGFTDSLVVGNLDGPTAIAFLPNGSLLITEQGGDLKLFDGTSTTTLVHIPVCSASEMGLLGVAVDPGFSGNNGFIYLYRTKAGSGGCGTSTGRFNQVVRVTMSAGSVNIGSLAELLSGIKTDGGNHNGGVVRIGPDGKLWVGVGDAGTGDNQGGPGSSTNPYAQDLTSLNGKILRLNLDGSAPADNPFTSPSDTRIWAYGFRNPFRMSFDGATGKLWIGDVGDLTVEEIDIGVSGGNYSWPRCEGNLQGPPNSPNPCVVGSDIAPVFTYSHGGAASLGTCVIGGAFAGSAFGSLSGHYVFGDCTSSTIYHLGVNAARDGFTGSAQTVSTNAGTPSDFVHGPDGAIYYTAVSGGEVRRLSVVLAGSDALLPGTMLTLRDNASRPAARAVTAVSTSPSIELGGGPTSSDDPTLHGGSLRVLSSAGGFDQTYPMPATGWRTLGGATHITGYQYSDPKQANGPVTSAMLRNGKLLRVMGKGAGLSQTLASNPDPVSVVLQTGLKRYCMSFGVSAGATTKLTAGTLFVARHAGPPASCPP